MADRVKNQPQKPLRRDFVKRMGLFGIGAGMAVFVEEEALAQTTQNVNRLSAPSDLKITDLRVATVNRAPMRCPLIRIDTNQGICGYGEVRDGGSDQYALMLKSRLLGENPCNVEKIFKSIKQFGFHGRQGGGVCGVEMALWDLAGKAYGVPVYQMLGGKYRDKIRIYCDTTSSNDAAEMGKRLKERMEDGFTFLKMDLGVSILRDIPGTVSKPLGNENYNNTKHPFTGMELTQKGIDILVEYTKGVREIIGYEIPLATDHFGHIGLNSCIRLGQALESCQLAWLEDMIPWEYTDLWREITEAVNVPTLTGEDIYLKEEFIKLIDTHAVDMIHPDLATSGGILETKRIGDYAEEHGVAMAMHFAGTPISCMANVHCAAATQNFIALENHSVDVPWWNDLVTGLPNPIVQKGYIEVPEAPGLGVELNEEVVKEHLLDGKYFEPTPEWNEKRSWDRLWS
ncbi:MAG: mandelate racemase/muconate lactonizing enzyme family protein [bacterium]|jgi:L-alanine-DL-glutamate epimerase-like enolase superfamily enzyme|nr:mandelate racemase/muconate lactonizing enzyme family protein [bacterium]